MNRDLPRLNPVNHKVAMHSLPKTGRLVVLHENERTGGLTCEAGGTAQGEAVREILEEERHGKVQQVRGKYRSRRGIPACR